MKIAGVRRESNICKSATASYATASGSDRRSVLLRAGSSIGPILVGSIVANLGIQHVFAAFAAVAIIGGLVTLLFAIETKGRVPEDLSP
jgi:putative MFS transporter